MIDVLLLSAIVTILYAVVVLFIGLSNTNINATGKWDLSLLYMGLVFPANSFSAIHCFYSWNVAPQGVYCFSDLYFYSVIVEPIAVNVLHYKYKTEIGKILSNGNF